MKKNKLEQQVENLKVWLTKVNHKLNVVYLELMKLKGDKNEH